MKRSLQKIYFLASVIFLSAFISLDAFSVPQDHRIDQFYAKTNHQLIWIQNGNLTPCGNILLETLRQAETEGLNGEVYSNILEIIQKIPAITLGNQWEIDRWMTFAALTYITAIKGERLNLQKVDKDITISRPSHNEVERLAGFLQADKTCTWLKTLAPPHPQYQFLKNLLAVYKMKQKTQVWPQIPVKTTLHKGDYDPLVQTIAQIFKNQEIPYDTDFNSLVFDEKFATSLQYYQRTHGLEPHGKLDASTIKALNVTIDEKIKQIIVTMERYRWLPSTLGERYIFVNIAGFYLQAVENSKTAFYMPVITGKNYRETPILNAPLTAIIFNPTWHVPHKIAIHDKLPLLQKNNDSLSSKGYHLYNQDGQEISFSSIDWSLVTPTSFSYQLRQDPGKFNALGKIRFTLENPYSIYLHGTPEQKLFDKTNRSLSSGCVRVENPVKLAEFVLKDAKLWPLHKIEEEASGRITKNIKLPTPLPIYLSYFTVWKDEYHHVHFVKDIYGQDRQIWDALKKADQLDLKKIASTSFELDSFQKSRDIKKEK